MHELICVNVIPSWCKLLSRLNHLSALLQNTYPNKIKSWRHVVYTCYQPRGMASARDLELKAQAWDRYQITTHLPAENIRVYDENFAKRKSPALPVDVSSMKLLILIWIQPMCA